MTSPPPPRPSGADRVRYYLLGEVERRDWVELWPRLIAARLQLIEALGGFTSTQASWRPGDGQWAATDVAAHLLDYTDGVLDVIEALARGRTPGHTPVDALGHVPEQPAEFRRLIRRLTEQAIRISVLPERLPSITDDILHAPTHAHPWFGQLPARGWFAFLRLHDEDHLSQLKQITSAAGFPASGAPATAR